MCTRFRGHVASAITHVHNHKNILNGGKGSVDIRQQIKTDAKIIQYNK